MDLALTALLRCPACAGSLKPHAFESSDGLCETGVVVAPAARRGIRFRSSCSTCCPRSAPRRAPVPPSSIVTARALRRSVSHLPPPPAPSPTRRSRPRPTSASTSTILPGDRTSSRMRRSDASRFRSRSARARCASGGGCSHRGPWFSTSAAPTGSALSTSPARGSPCSDSISQPPPCCERRGGRVPRDSRTSASSSPTPTRSRSRMKPSIACSVTGACITFPIRLGLLRRRRAYSRRAAATSGSRTTPPPCARSSIC